MVTEDPSEWTDLLQWVQRSAGTPLTGPALDTALELAARLAVGVLPDTVGSSITLSRDGKFGTPAFAGRVAGQLDATQLALGDGPCITAALDRSPVRIESTDEDSRWPQFAQTARRHGVHSTLSLPLKITGNSAGAFNVYAARTGAYSEQAQAVAQVISGYISTLLNTAAPDAMAPRVTSAQMQRALTQRTTIAQAQGVLMGRDGLDSEQAYRLLVEQSRHDDRRLADIAQAVLDGLVPADDDGTHR